MEQKWTLDKDGMCELSRWLQGRKGANGIESQGDDRITVELVPDPKCKFCGVGEVYHNDLCLFCYTCLPSPVADNDVSGNYSKENWMDCFRDTVRRAHEKGLLK